MSGETWLAEFYPRAADSVSTDREAVEHSLRKWEGLRSGNLERHGVKLDGLDVVEGGSIVLPIDSQTCALCELHMATRGDSCPTCPLSQVRGDVDCCSSREDESIFDGRPNPWVAWSRKKDPEPMIFWLGKALEQLE